MMMKSRIGRVAALLCAAAVLTSSAGQAKAGGISDAQQEKDDLKQELDEVQKLVDQLQGSKDSIESNVERLDQKLTEISERIASLEARLKEKETAIGTTQEELIEAQANEKKQYEEMKLRIRFLYENGTHSFLAQLLSSENMADFLNKAEYIAQISQYDRKMLVKYQETVENTAQLTETLKLDQKELAHMKEQVTAEQQSVAALLDAKEEQLAQVGDEISDAQSTAQAYEAEIQAQDEIIAQIRAEEARKQEAARKKVEEQAKRAEEARKKEEEKKAEQETPDQGGQDTGDQTEGGQGEEGQPEDTDQNTGSGDSGAAGGESTDPGSADDPEEPEPEEPSYNGGGFAWPCPSSRRVTSDFGGRDSPTAGASTYHKGIDIGAAYGADIVAASAGSVTFAGYSSGAGNYVTVSHGNGIYTVYMHASSLVVSNGQTVAAGEVIAKVGSTGISTGNHLHFGVSLNGSYVSPWDYLR